VFLNTCVLATEHHNQPEWLDDFQVHLCTLCTSHCTPFIIHCTVYTVQSHCTQFIVYCTLHTVHRTLHTVHLTLYTVHRTLPTVHRTLHTVHRTLHTLHRTMNTVHRALDTANCTPFIVHCTLYTRVSSKRTVSRKHGKKCEHFRSYFANLFAKFCIFARAYEIQKWSKMVARKKKISRNEFAFLLETLLFTLCPTLCNIHPTQCSVQCTIHYIHIMWSVYFLDWFC